MGLGVGLGAGVGGDGEEVGQGSGRGGIGGRGVCAGRALALGVGFKGGKRWRRLDERLRWVGMEGCTACSCCWDGCLLGVLSMEVSPGTNERIVDTHPTFSLFFMRRRHRCTPDCGPLCHRDTPGRPTRHGRRINRQEADERHREIDVDGVVERDAECVGDVDEFGPADG